MSYMPVMSRIPFQVSGLAFQPFRTFRWVKSRFLPASGCRFISRNKMHA